MTLTQISAVLIETNPWTSASGDPVLADEYRGLPAEWLAVLDYMLAHPDLTYCWRCDEPVGFVLFENGIRWVSTGLAREGDGLVAMLCDECTPYVPAPVLAALDSFPFTTPETAAFFRKAEKAQQPGVTDRAWRGEFALGDLVAASAGSPLRSTRVAGVVTHVNGAKVAFQTEADVFYEVFARDARHARVVSDTICQLYGATPKPALELVR